MVTSFSENVSTQANGAIKVCFIHIAFSFAHYAGLELEAQYWRVADLLCRLIKMNLLDCRSPLHRKHFEFFPHNFRMNTSQVRRIRREMGCYLGGEPGGTTATIRITDSSTEATTLSQSTAASMFWTLDQMNQVVNQLASIGMHVCTVQLAC
jgi:hypothetical protein